MRNGAYCTDLHWSAPVSCVGLAYESVIRDRSDFHMTWGGGGFQGVTKFWTWRGRGIISF